MHANQYSNIMDKFYFNYCFYIKKICSYTNLFSITLYIFFKQKVEDEVFICINYLVKEKSFQIIVL